MIMEMTRRTALVAAAALAAVMTTAPTAAQPAPAAAATSAPTRTYAIVSLIGDEFSVVSRRQEVGSRLDPNERTGLPVLRALIRDSRLFALQDKLWTETAESHDMRIALRDLLAKAGATDLILVTKQRGTPAFKVMTGQISASGSISGIGFYIDNVTGMYNSVSKAGGEGFLAPYAYLSVTSIDIASMRVVRTKHGLETSMALAVEKQGATHAWDALSGKEKVEALDYVIRRAVDAGMSGLVVE